MVYPAIDHPYTLHMVNEPPDQAGRDLHLGWFVWVILRKFWENVCSIVNSWFWGWFKLLWPRIYVLDVISRQISNLGWSLPLSLTLKISTFEWPQMVDFQYCTFLAYEKFLNFGFEITILLWLWLSLVWPILLVKVIYSAYFEDCNEISQTPEDPL